MKGSRAVAAFGVAVLVVAAVAFVAFRTNVQADNTTAMSFLATDMRAKSDDPEGTACGIGRSDGAFPGWVKQVLVMDADGRVVAKQSLLDGVVNGNGACEVRFSIPFPDSQFVTIYVDEDRVTTLAKSDLDTLADEPPMNLFIRE